MFDRVLLPNNLKLFIKNSNWTPAKTYAKTWPHEYIVQEKVDNKLYLELANYIDQSGYEDYFYKTKQIYFRYGNYTYWHMENIINRCLNKNTYYQRKKDDRLPDKE
ncbi:MAG: hypothetical protein U9R42_14740 [Bacteroidota bacterium]|nr:hypothetical protein [Bacteroidota bacterium]